MLDTPQYLGHEVNNNSVLDSDVTELPFSSGQGLIDPTVLHEAAAFSA
jgi:hypothetical protein